MSSTELTPLQLAETESNIPAKVAVLESSVKQLHGEITDVRASVAQVQASVTAGFNEVKRDLIARSSTNWGWVTSAASVVIVLVMAIGTAWLRPIQIQSETMHEQLSKLYDRHDEDHDQLLRLEERVKLYEKLGVIPRANQ